MFTRNIPVLGANAECRREGEVRQFIVFADFFDKVFYNLCVINPLTCEYMDNRTACILCLELILFVQKLEYVISIIYRQLR